MHLLALALLLVPWIANHSDGANPSMLPRTGAGSTSTVIEFDAAKLTKVERRKAAAARPRERALVESSSVLGAFAGKSYEPGAAFATIGTMGLRDGSLWASLHKAEEVGWASAQFDGSGSGSLRVTLKTEPGKFVISCLVGRSTSEPTTFEITAPGGLKHEVVLSSLLVDWLHMTVSAPTQGEYTFAIRGDRAWMWGRCDAAPAVSK